MADDKKDDVMCTGFDPALLKATVGVANEPTTPETGPGRITAEQQMVVFKLEELLAQAKQGKFLACIFIAPHAAGTMVSWVGTSGREAYFIGTLFQAANEIDRQTRKTRT